MKIQNALVKYSLYSVGLFFLLSFSFIQPKNELRFIVRFKHFVGARELVMDSFQYKNEFQQSFSVTKFRYYISNLRLKRTDGTEFVSNEYYLIDEMDAASKSIIIPERADYSSISFSIGVDSLHNCSGVQKGTLDPAKGMFWAWNTGYVFMKLDGKYALADSQYNVFQYHIGGYKQPNNNIRKVNLEIIKNTAFYITTNTDEITIAVDIAEIFKTPTSIDFTKLSMVTDFNNASAIADNYADMFSIMKLK